MEHKGTDPCSKQPACCPVDTETVTSIGKLPPVMTLAAGYVPSQKPGCVQYDAKNALAHGTLYPALFLPFKNMYSVSDLPSTPMVQIMALDFAVIELGLYLDTHPTDKDALQMYADYRSVLQDLKNQYEEQFGPLEALSSNDPKEYAWVADPWPWNKQKGV